METGIGFSSSYCAPDLPKFYFSKPLKQNRLTSMISASFSRQLFEIRVPRPDSNSLILNPRQVIFPVLGSS